MTDQPQTTIKSRIISLIRERMKSWGHNNAPGCVSCATAKMVIKEIETEIQDDERIVDGVRIKGPIS